MEFPQASIEQARWIAQQYRARSTTKQGIAGRLYDGEFIHLGYGFEDALRFGRTGTYLHEAKKDVECYSLAGILYLIARETGLEPHLYRASDYATYKEGTPESDIAGGGEHAFITVTINGKEWIVDPFQGMFGEMKHDVLEHRLKVKKKDGEYKFGRYSMLTPLTPDEYIARLEESRRPGQGASVLNAGQIVHIRGKRVMFSLDQGTFWSSAEFSNEVRYQGDEEQWSTFALRGDVGGVAQRRLVQFYAADTAWLPQDRAHTGRIVLPMDLVNEYLSHVVIAAKAQGLRSPLHRTRKNHSQRFYDFGFGRFGQLERDNGVDAGAHAALLDRVDATYASMERSARTALVLARDGAYFRERRERACAENPLGLLCSPQELRNHLEKRILAVEEKELAAFELRSKIPRRIADGQKRVLPLIRKLGVMNNAIDCIHQREYSFISLPVSGERFFHETLDHMLFRQEHPLDTLSASDDDVLLAYRARVRDMIASSSWLLPVLEAKRWMPGIKRLLS